MAGAKDQSADGFIAWLGELNAQIGIPRTLADSGVKPEHVDRLVAVAVADACHLNNPRPVQEADFRVLFDRALTGA
jgi:alcohol dehydrogenase class IV